MVRALPFRTPTRLDLGRILAIAAAIALHVFALLLLLMPMAAPQIAQIVDQRTPIPLPAAPIPTPPLPPQPVEPIKDKLLPKPVTPPVAVLPTQIPDTASAIDQGTLPATSDALDTAPVGDIAPPDTSPMVGSQLQYVKAPAPPYPSNEARAGVEGTVVLRILVDVDGTPLDVVIETSSGNRNLDRQARQHVLKHWRFKPAVRDGIAVQAYGLVPIDFVLR
jgi:protein TonB